MKTSGRWKISPPESGGCAPPPSISPASWLSTAVAPSPPMSSMKTAYAFAPPCGSIWPPAFLKRRCASIVRCDVFFFLNFLQLLVLNGNIDPARPGRDGDPHRGDPDLRRRGGCHQRRLRDAAVKPMPFSSGDRSGRFPVSFFRLFKKRLPGRGPDGHAQTGGVFLNCRKNVDKL